MNALSDPSKATMDIAMSQWFKFLSTWAMITILVCIMLLFIFIAGIGFSPSDNALGIEYSELMQAVRTPIMHRLFTAFDAAGWVMMSGVLLILAMILRRISPKRSLFIMACSLGLITGIIAGFLRFVSYSDLASVYASSTAEQQRALLPSAYLLNEIIGSLFVVGDFLAGAGWLLVASVGFALTGFPRWLAAWFSFAGILSLLQGATSGLGMFSFPILLFTIVFGVLGLHAAIFIAFWRPSPKLISSVERA